MSVYEIISVCLSIVLSAISIIIAIKKTEKNKQSNKLIELFDKIPTYINQAEQMFGPHTGLAKFQYVMNNLQIECLKNNLKVDELTLQEKIESVLNTPTTIK